MARTPTPKQRDEPTPAAAASDPMPAQPAPARLGLREYLSGVRLDPMHVGILTVTHAATKATPAEWEALLAQALARPVQ
jgi:hypothetical protein